MKAIILAAGNGVRMRPLTDVLPKPLLTVGRMTLLDHLVSKFPKEIDELVIVVRHLGEKIKNYCGKEFYGRTVVYVQQPPAVNGTFAALKVCEKLLRSNERFFVFYADDLISAKAIKDCLKHRCAIVASAVADPEKFGVIQIDGEEMLVNILEKPTSPQSNVVLTNTMLLDKSIFQFEPTVNPNGEQYLTHALCDLAKIAKIKVVKTDSWLPIGYPEDLLKAESFLV